MKHTIKATVKGFDTKINTEYDFLDTVNDKLEAYGEEVVNTLFERAAVTALRNFCHSRIRNGHTEEEILAELETWTPTVGKTGTRKTKAEKIKSTFVTLDADEQMATLEELEALIAQLKGNA